MAKRAASGWKQATPIPLISAASHNSGRNFSTPSAATPPPARKIPAAISQGIERRSARWPIAGWITEDDIAWHATRIVTPA